MLSRIEILKAIAHPARIAIMQELLKGVKCVSDFQDFLEISQPNISQHLSILKNAGIVDFFIDGRLKCYFLIDPMIPDLLDVLNKEYPDELARPECCPVTRKGIYPGKRRK